MKHTSVLLTLLLLASYSCFGIGAFFTNFVVKNIGICNDIQRQIKFYPRITTEKNGEQYFTHNLTLPFPVGNNIGLIGLIQTKIVGNEFTDLFTIREKNLCKAFNKYMGEFWYDVERESGVTPGVCPIQQGRYHGNHIQLHFEKISLQTFPFGTLKFTLQGIDNHSKDCVWCYWTIVENIVN